MLCQRFFEDHLTLLFRNIKTILVICVVYFSDRFCEQINPLLVHAQHKLTQRCLEYGGGNSSQQHFTLAQEKLKADEPELKHKTVTTQNYYKLQLELDKDAVYDARMNPAAHIEPGEFDLYSGKAREKRRRDNMFKSIKYFYPD